MTWIDRFIRQVRKVHGPVVELSEKDQQRKELVKIHIRHCTLTGRVTTGTRPKVLLPTIKDSQVGASFYIRAL